MTSWTASSACLHKQSNCALTPKASNTPAGAQVAGIALPGTASPSSSRWQVAGHSSSAANITFGWDHHYWFILASVLIVKSNMWTYWSTSCSSLNTLQISQVFLPLLLWLSSVGRQSHSDLQLAAASALLLLLICIKLSFAQPQIDGCGRCHCAACGSQGATCPSSRAYTENEWQLAAFDAHEAFGVSAQ